MPRKSRRSRRVDGLVRSHSISPPHRRQLRLEPLEDRRMLAVIGVTNLNDSGPGSLRDVVSFANSLPGADTIVFPSGVDGGTISLTSGEIAITEAITIQATNVTINANSASRIFRIASGTGNVTLTGLTLTGGKTTGFAQGGGAIRSLATSHLTLNRSTISGNTTAGEYASGGGIYSYGPLTLVDSIVSGNSTTVKDSSGGGILSIGPVTLTNSSVLNNWTTQNYSSGGGIASLVDVKLTNSTVSGNSTAGNNAKGGGIITSQGTVRLYDSTVSGNSTTGFGSSGGGIFMRSNATLLNSTVSGNSTTGNFAEGGGIYGKYVFFHSSTISGNSTAGSFSPGGGISGTNEVGLNNSTVSGNSTAGNSSDGGGIVSTGIVRVIQSTIADNRVLHIAGRGGGISMTTFSSGTLTINSSIVAGNLAGSNNPDLLLGVATWNIDYSLIGNTSGTTIDGGSGAGNVLNISPQLAPLANTGGPTKTHALLATSSARNGGDPSITSGFDQRGAPFVRVFGGRADMGAFEAQPIVVDNASDVVDGNYSSGNLSLREAIEFADANSGIDTIRFAKSLGGQTITLTQGELFINVLSQGLKIDGTSVNPTINADQHSRIFNVSGTGNLTLTGLTLTGGWTTGSGASGGAIKSRTTGLLTINSSTISGNTTTGFGFGGGVYAIGPLRLYQSTVSGNSTTGDGALGGGVWAGVGATVIQSTISGNNTSGINSHGGGLWAYGPLTFEQSTVTNNRAQHATAKGGGVFQPDSSNNYLLTMDSTIIAGNVAPTGTDVLTDPHSAKNVAYSLIGNTTSSGITAGTGPGNLLNVAPQLGPLANNGGPTPTHALLDGSPALNAGSPDIMSGTDQRGAPFVRVAGPRADIGAYERQIVPGLNLVVDTLADENDGDYSAGDLSLREAIGLANGADGADTITFAAALSGTTIALSGTELVITEVVTIDARPLVENVTINASGQSRIFNITAQSGNFTIGGLNLTNGLAVIGGAIRANGTSFLSVSESTLSGNIAASGGGAIYNYLGVVIVSDSTITGNLAAVGGGIFTYGDVSLLRSAVSSNFITGAGSGGGIYAGRDVNLTDSTVSSNLAPNASSGGGGIFSSGFVTLTRSTVRENVARGPGGGIRATDAVMLTDSTVRDNQTIGTFGGGGGIFVLSNVTLIRSTVSGNLTTGNNSVGGGIYATGGALLIQSTLSGNFTTGLDAVGGGMRVVGPVNLDRSTVSGNRTEGGGSHGGGIFASSSVAITQSTITANQVTGGPSVRGGGVFQADTPANAIFTIDGSIFSANIGTTSPNVFADPDVTVAARYSLVGAGISAGSGVGNVPTNAPLLGPLADNGGPTKTHLPLEESPAKNAGDPSAVFSASEFDQRGAPFVRVFGGQIDIGAVERQPFPPAFFGDYNQNGVVDAADYVVWRKTLGATGITPYSGADGNGNGMVDDADYGVWRSHFGITLPATGAAEASAEGGVRSREGPSDTSNLFTSEQVESVAHANQPPVGDSPRRALPEVGEVELFAVAQESAELRADVRHAQSSAPRNVGAYVDLSSGSDSRFVRPRQDAAAMLRTDIARPDDALLAWAAVRFSDGIVREGLEPDVRQRDESDDRSDDSFHEAVDAALECEFVEL